MKKLLIILLFLFPVSCSENNVKKEMSLIILDKIFKNGNKSCNEQDFGNYLLEDNPITLIDISNDGIEDLIINPNYQRCEKSHSWFAGGTGGNNFIFFINPTIDIVKSWDPSNWVDDKEKRIYHILLRSFELIKWKEKNALKIQEHGVGCGVDGVQGCYSIVSVSEKGLKLLDGPHPNPL